jgi:hypothetical protein
MDNAAQNMDDAAKRWVVELVFLVGVPGAMYILLG